MIKLWQTQNGVTLIELIITIVLLSVLGTAFTTTIRDIFSNTDTVKQTNRALFLASQRMELLLGQKQIAGFSNFTDPCTANPSSDLCIAPTGYSVSVTPSLPPSSTSQNQQLVVTATSPDGQQLSLTTIVGNYS